MDLTSSRRQIHRLAAALVSAAVLVFALSAAASAAPVRGAAPGARMRVGHAPVLPAGASARGALPRSSVIDATVALQPRDSAALAAYAHAVSTPGSSLYHHYLTVPEFARRFAPGAAAIAAVRAALEAQGLHPGPLAANGLSLDLTASAATLSGAFATSFVRYRTRGGETAFANTTAPALPAAVSGLVQGVIGLDSLQAPTPAGLTRSHRARAHARRATGRATTAPGEGQACAGALGSGGFTAGQIAGAYGLSDLYAAGDGGTGVTVAVFELEPYSASDLAAYQSCYGTSTSVTNMAIDGGPGTGSGSGEAALDIEDLIGLAPNAAILVYEGKNSGAGAMDTYRTIVTQDRANVISTSWGLCEPQEGSSAAATENTLFQEAAVQGQTILAAAGDHGVQDCSGGWHSGSAAVDDPASQPYVTGVGGSSLNAEGPPPSENVWNSSWSSGYATESGAGGGGVSSLWGQPSYQAGFAPAQSSVTCAGSGASCREVPDVAADADILTGYDIYYRGRWSIFGGTSAAAPTWAALVALADASAACTGKTAGFANPALYQAAAASYGTYFNDITRGDNSYGGLTGFSATAGYDMASGLGSPKGGPVAAALCGSTSTPPVATTTPAPAPAPAPAPVVTLTRIATQKPRVGRALRLQLHASDSAGQGLTYRATHLPAGLTLSSATGLVSGSPTRPGRVRSTITVTDASGSTVQGSIAWNVAGRPTITGRLSVSRKGRPWLAMTVGAGANAPPIQSVVVVPSDQVRFSRMARDLARGVAVRNRAGRRLKSTARLRGASLLVTLSSDTVRSASLRITVPAIVLVKRPRRASGARHKASVVPEVTVMVTDVSDFRTAFSIR